MSKNPYERAHQRIRKAISRGWDAEKHAFARLKRCVRPAKIAGIYWAAKDYGMSEVAKAAKVKYKAITGFSPA